MLIQFKKLCRRCGGSGNKLLKIRPFQSKRCAHCGGRGVCFKVIMHYVESLVA